MNRNNPAIGGQASSSSTRSRLTLQQTFLTKKMFELTSILQADVNLIFCKVLEKNLLTHREYNNLKDSGTCREEKITNLLDSLIQKGKVTCDNFISLLKEDETINETFPRLNEVEWVEPDDTGRRALSTNTATNNSTRTESVDTQTIRGYIHNVSEIRSGPLKKYFDVVVQSETENKAMRVFRPLRRPVFVSAESNRSPVQLIKVQLQTSIFNNREELCFTNSSDVTILGETIHFPFKVEAHMPLADLHNNENSKDSKVTVAVKVNEKSKTGHRSTRATSYLYCEDYEVADQTEGATLTVWKRQNAIEVDKWYLITQVTVSVHDGRVTLNTTANSVIEETASTGETVPCDNPQPVTFTGRIIGANFSLTYTCPKDHLLVKVNRALVKCQRCSITFSRPHINRIVNGKLSIRTSDEGVKEVEVQDAHVRHLLCKEMADSETQSKMVKAILKLPPVRVTILRANVLTITVEGQDDNTSFG